MNSIPHPDRIRCVVTGANGFIGTALIPHLHRLGHTTVGWPRSDAFDLTNTSSAAQKVWYALLKDADVVVHLAGLAHQPRKTQNTAAYFQLNRDGTLQLARAAQAAGVKRFIFLSSAKVFGEGGDTIYSINSAPEPQDSYAQSKWQAEQQLVAQFSRSMEIVILRPPLVYGPHAKANFANLVKLARLPIPLPFAGIDNKRAMIGIDNLIDLIGHCLTSPMAAGKTFVCADAQVYSLADIVTSIRRTLNSKPNLFRLPQPVFATLSKMLGSSVSTRLFGDFQIDCRETKKILNWTPPYTMERILRHDAGNSR